MKLQDYLIESGLTATAFASRTGVTQPTVQRWISGKRHPSLDSLRRIAVVTNGRVQPNDFLDGVSACFGRES